jgi:hypothetical protein
VDSTGQDAGGLDTGAAGQQTAITPPPAETQVVKPTGADVGTQTTQTQQAEAQGQKPPPAPTVAPQPPTPTAAPIVKTAAQQKLDELNSLFGDDGLPATRRTNEQIARDDKVDAIAEQYGLTRKKGESSQDLKGRITEVLLNTAEFEQARGTDPKTNISNIPLSEVSEQTIAKQQLGAATSYIPPDLQIEEYEKEQF